MHLSGRMANAATGAWSNGTTARPLSNTDLNTYLYVGDHGSCAGGGHLCEFRGLRLDLRENLSVLHHFLLDRPTNMSGDHSIAFLQS